MKQRIKGFLNTICLTAVIGFLTACLPGGGGDDPVPPRDNPTTGGGTLSLANAPQDSGGSFVADVKGTSAGVASGALIIGWFEYSLTTHLEGVELWYEIATGKSHVDFLNSGLSPEIWTCNDHDDVGKSLCSGITVDKTGGVVTFSNQVLVADAESSAAPITLNGTLTFTPPAGITPTPAPGANPPPGSGTIKGNNSALLSGAAIGSGTTAVGSLRKQIAVTVLGANTSFTVGTAYAARGSTSSDAAYVVMPLTNIGTQTLCLVKLAGLTYRNASGTVVGVPSFTYVNGSVGKISSTTSTNTCVAPGETGMMSDIELNIYAAVAKMEFTFEVNNFTVTTPSASVIPQSYTVQTTDLFPVININVKNVGSGPAQIGKVNFSKVFLLDDAEQPLMWGFTESNYSDSIVVPAASSAIITSNIFYGGAASKLLVHVGFEDTAATARLRATTGIALPASETCAASLSTDDLMLCMNELRNQQLDSLKSNYDAQFSTP